MSIVGVKQTFKAEKLYVCFGAAEDITAISSSFAPGVCEWVPGRPVFGKYAAGIGQGE